MGLVYLWVMPDSARLFQVFFLLANGPLAWSVLAFSQSLVFHSHAHMTSVVVHVSPMLVSFCFRWTTPPPNGPAFGPEFITCEGECAEVPPLSMLLDGVRMFYLPWIVGYYIWVFLCLGDRIKQRSYQTLYDRVVSQGPPSKALKCVFSATGATSELAKKALYMMMHLLFGVVTMGLALSFWYSPIAHTAFILAICGASVWNASGYYFTVFAQR